jgi:hypothetical protein
VGSKGGPSPISLRAEWESKENINAGVNDSNFFLVTGGDTRQEVELRSYPTITPPGLVLPNSLVPHLPN